MKKKIIVLSLLMLFMLALAAVEISEYYFRFLIYDLTQLDKIGQIVSIDDLEDNYAYAYATAADLETFKAMGYYPELLQHPGTLYRPIMSDSIENLREWDTYPTYEAFVNIMNQFAADYPEICSVLSIGHTVNGRELLVARISDNVSQQETEPEFFYSATMHGDETAGYIFMLNLIDLLLSDYGVDQQITDIVDGLDIYIAPLANPDGTYHGGNNSVYSATRFNANAVDLNRNFPDPAYGPHPDGNDWQPETIAMMDFASTHHITMGGNLHGGAELINYPWDAWIELHPDDDWFYYTSVIYASSAQENSPAGYLTDENNGVTNGYAWYPAHGGRQDYMTYFKHARETTMELSHTKLLPENQLQNFWNYNKAALLLYMEECMYGLHGVVTNSNADPLDAKVFVLDHDDRNTEVYTDPGLGDYHRLIAEGSYDIEFSSYGYRSNTIYDVAITNGVTSSLDIVLEAAPQFTVSGLVTNGNLSAPLEGVAIEFLDAPLPVIVTNSAGTYQFDDVFEGNYSVSITADGFSAIIEEINVAAGNTEFDFVIYLSEIESFENGNFADYPWSFDGDAIWSIDSDVVYDGDFAARSGSIAHNQETSLLINMDVTAQGTISFFYKVSSEMGYDFFKFYIDGNQMESWSGEQDWTQYSYFIDTGMHTFCWTYMKDGGVASGEDCVWLDLVAFPCTSGLSAPGILQPMTVELKGNHPNPFNPTTTISFSINSHEEVHTSLEIYNVRGQKVKTLLAEPLSTDTYNIVWNGKNDNDQTVASGLYYYKLKIDQISRFGKMLMLK